MHAIILSIGDELVLGQTVDTNSAYIAGQLSAVGCDVIEHRTVADDRAAIAAAMRQCAERADVLIVSGGIGPTEDDLTRDALADVLGQPLEIHPPALERLNAFFERLGRAMPERNKVQALLPRGAVSLDNPHGTAPGMRAEYHGEAAARTPRRVPQPHQAMFPKVFPLPPLRRTRKALSPAPSCVIFVMPGVPKEMKPMFQNHVLPYVRERAGGAVILQRKLNTFGLGESVVAERLGGLMMRQRNPSVGTTVSGGMVSVRVNARFENQAIAQAELAATCAACEAALGDYFFGYDDTTIVDALVGLLEPTAGRPWRTVATAESCTGGLLAKVFTDRAGSSDYFKQGWITYTNESKSNQLGVSTETLRLHGAVSEPVVIEMAEGARARSGCDFALSVSGIAGPGGGSEAKPVGTVCIGFAHAGGATARTFRFTGDRDMVRDRSAKMALTLLRFHLLGKPLMP